jgi:hypothetical protein
MYERVGELWKQYCTKYSGEWVGDDPRHDLSAEVRERLTQLDLVLEHLRRALALVAIDPERAKRDAEWFAKAQPLGTRRNYSGGFCGGVDSHVSHI